MKLRMIGNNSKVVIGLWHVKVECRNTASWDLIVGIAGSHQVNRTYLSRSMTGKGESEICKCTLITLKNCVYCIVYLMCGGH